MCSDSVYRGLYWLQLKSKLFRKRAFSKRPEIIHSDPMYIYNSDFTLLQLYKRPFTVFTQALAWLIIFYLDAQVSFGGLQSDRIAIHSVLYSKLFVDPPCHMYF